MKLVVKKQLANISINISSSCSILSIPVVVTEWLGEADLVVSVERSVLVVGAAELWFQVEGRLGVDLELFDTLRHLSKYQCKLLNTQNTPC